MGSNMLWKHIIYDFTFTWYLKQEHKNIHLVNLISEEVHFFSCKAGFYRKCRAIPSSNFILVSYFFTIHLFVSTFMSKPIMNFSHHILPNNINTGNNSLKHEGIGRDRLQKQSPIQKDSSIMRKCADCFLNGVANFI